MGAGSIRRLRGPAREVRAREVIGRFAASGSSKAGFCRDEGISTVTLSRWLSQFGAVSTARHGGGFVEVRLDRGPAGSGFVLELCTGPRLRIPPGFAALDLERLLAVLARARC